MNIHSTDICRDDEMEYPDDPKATKERIVMFFCSMALGIVIGITGVVAYYGIIGKPCSAAPYCTEHVVKDTHR